MGCEVHSVMIGDKRRSFFFPCDYLDGKIVMANDESRDRLVSVIQYYWDSEEKIKETYNIRSSIVEACRKGIGSYGLYE